MPELYFKETPNEVMTRLFLANEKFYTVYDMESGVVCYFRSIHESDDHQVLSRIMLRGQPTRTWT